MIGLFTRIQEAQSNGFITGNETLKKMKELHVFIYSIHEKEKMRTPQDIIFLNSVIDTVIKELKNKVSLQ